MDACQARRALGWKTAEVVKQDLTDEQARALSVTLNRTAELAGWDSENLSDAFKALDGTEFAMDLFGWTVSEVKAHQRLLGQGVQDISPEEAFAQLGKEKTSFQQMTFVLHDSQVEIVKSAISDALGRIGDESCGNANKNGNALAHICKMFMVKNG